MILQRIVYPHTPTFEEILYARFNREHVALIGEENSIVSSNCYERIGFDTYFNTFSVRKWAKYTTISNVKLTLDILGKARVVLTRLELHGNTVEEHIAASEVVDHHEKSSVTTSYPPIENEDAYSFYVYPLSEQVEISGGAYTSDVDEESLREVRLALAICTYRREAFLQRNIHMLQKQIIDNPDSMLRGKVKVYISDNGKTLDPSKLNSESITVYPNPNYGGAGGFTRSTIEAIEDIDFAPTHVILMDDDIQFDVEALERTFVFQRLIKPEYSSSMIGGAMFPLDNRAVLHASGETFTINGITSNKFGYDMSRVFYILKNDVEESINHFAWWFCCVPIELLAKDQYALPLFFQYDDIEFSIRNDDVPKITLNGICCWHSSFNRWPGIKAYYTIRNCAIVKSICFDEYSRTRFLWEVSKRAIKNLFQMSYEEANLALLGGEDFLKGLSWLSKQDPEALNSKVYSLCEKLVPAEELSPAPDLRNIKWNDNIGQGKRRGVFRWLTLNGLLLPSRKTVTVELNNPPLRYLYRVKTAVKYDTYSKKGVVHHRNYKEASKIAIRWAKLCWNTMRHFSAAVKDNRETRDIVTTKKFWKEYLDL